jgi:hypothetical protein
MTFRAWVESCLDCGPEPVEEGTASWLLEGPEQLFFSVAPGAGWAQSAVPDPGLVSSVNLGPGSLPGWVQVTGHFDDPRAAECRRTPLPVDYGFYGGRDEAVATCRQQFVVTAIETVEAP